MRVTHLLYISLQSFKNRKSRLLFTVLGVAIAVAAVLSLVAFGYGLQKNLLEQITTEDSILALDIVSSDPEVIRLNDETLNKIKKNTNVDRVSAQAAFPGQIGLNGVFSEVTVNIIDTNFFSLDGATVKEGTLFNGDGKGKLIVNSTLADTFVQKSILNNTVNLAVYVQQDKANSEVEIIKAKESLSITGIVESQSGRSEIFVTRDALKDLPITEYKFAKVKVLNDKVMEEVRGELIEMGFFVSALSDTITQANKIFRIIQIILGIFGIIALIVAAIGLINTMTISLLERTNEIGIMRALGASPSDIWKVFIGESILIGFSGGVSGIVIGFVFSETVNWIINIIAKSLGSNAISLFAYPTWFLLFIVILSGGVGLLAGLWPAFRASRMNPLDALRYK